MNTSEDRMVQLTLSLQMRERWLVVVECTAYFSVVLTAFMGNILFALTFYKIRTLRTPQNYYLVSLAVTDILNAAACSIALVALAEETWPYGYFICQLQRVIMSICWSVSTLTLGMIAINRYTKICRSRSLYQKIFSKRNVLTFIGISWIATSTLVVSAFFARRTVYFYHPGKCWCFYKLDMDESLGLYITFCYSMVVSFSFSATFFSYYKAFRKIHAHYVQVRNSSLRDENSRALAEELKITFMLLVTVLAFFICWTLSFITYLCEVFGGYYTLPRLVYMLNVFTSVGSSVPWVPEVFSRVRRGASSATGQHVFGRSREKNARVTF